MERSPDGHKSLVVPATVGAGVGGIVVGLLVGALGILAFRRWRRNNKHRENPNRDSLLSSNSSRNRREMTDTGWEEYIVEPFDVPSALRPSPPCNPGVSLPPGGNMSILCIAMVGALLLRYMVKRVRRSSSFRRNTPRVATVRRRRVKHRVKLTEGSPVQHLGLGRRENHVLREVWMMLSSSLLAVYLV